MDFLHRNANNQPQTARPAGSPASAAAAATTAGIKRGKADEPRWQRIVFVVLLFSVTIITLAIALLMYFGKDKEGGYIHKDRIQAVFLTNGQVYFGKITGITKQYLDLQDIYYLNSQQQPESAAKSTTQQTNFSLVKLGCELHGPSDQMIINREQVSFWENLIDDGKVAKAIEQWKSQNPNGQTCSENTTSTQQSQSTTGTTTPATTTKP